MWQRTRHCVGFFFFANNSVADFYKDNMTVIICNIVGLMLLKWHWSSYWSCIEVFIEVILKYLLNWYWSNIEFKRRMNGHIIYVNTHTFTICVSDWWNQVEEEQYSSSVSKGFYWNFCSFRLFRTRRAFNHIATKEGISSE